MVRGGLLSLAALAVVVAFLLPSPAAEGALTTETLVSNAGRGNASPSATNSTFRRAQVFTTGSNPAGYQLHEITVKTSGAGLAFDAAIYEVDSDGDPDTTSLVYNLTRPASFDRGTKTFTAPAGSTLNPDTQYALVFTPQSPNTIQLDLAPTNNGLDPGTATGWSIDTQYYRGTGGALLAVEDAFLKIQIKGAAFNNDPTFDDGDMVTYTVAENVAGASIGTPSATDGDGDSLTYTLGSGAPTGLQINSTTGALSLPSGTSLDHEDGASYTFVVQVRDSLDDERDSNTSPDDTITVILNVTDVDEPGTLAVSPDPPEAGRAVTATLTEGDDYTVDSWRWELGERQSDSTIDWTVISTATTATYTPTAADIGLFLRVTVQSDDPFTDDKTLQFETQSAQPGNDEPVFSGIGVTRELHENVTAVTNVGAAVTAIDFDMDTLEYGFESTGDYNSFTIDSGTGQIKTKTTETYDFETDNEYTLTVRVRDKKDVAGQADLVWDDTITVTVNIVNLDEAGVVTITGTRRGGQTLTASVTDPDIVDTDSSITWIWSRRTPGDLADNTIVTSLSPTYRLVAADVGKHIKARAIYRDGFESGRTAELETAAIAANNQEPVFTEGATATRTLPENSAGGINVGAAVSATDGDAGAELTYTLTGTDASSFTFDSTTGQIKTKAGITYNFEAKNSYSVVVNVRDSKDAAGDADSAIDDSITVTINLTNVNEAPTITTSATARNFQENGTGTIITFAATDVDASDTKTWSINTAAAFDHGHFDISTSGALTFKAPPDFEMPQDVDSGNTYTVTVKVTDTGGLSDSHTITITVTNENEAPVITTTTDDFTLPNAEENQTAVATYVATDVDAGTVFTWSVSGEDAAFFNITRNTDGHGVLTFKTPPDFEDPKDDADADSVDADGNYDLTITVRDNGSPTMTDTIDVSVYVVDVNEAPVITTAIAGAAFDEGATGTIITFTATDVDDGDTLTWSVESADDGDKFNIDSSSGALTFKTSPDYENPQDTDTNNTYVVTVKVTDDGGEGSDPNLSDTYEFTVSINPVNEAPEITTTGSGFTAPEVEENTPATTAVATPRPWPPTSRPMWTPAPRSRGRWKARTRTSSTSPGIAMATACSRSRPRRTSKIRKTTPTTTATTPTTPTTSRSRWWTTTRPSAATRSMSPSPSPM